MIPGTLQVGRFTRTVTQHSAAGTVTEPMAFVRLEVDNGVQRVTITVDAGEWSKMLATPGRAAPAELEGVETSARAG